MPISRYSAVTGTDWPELRPGRRVLVSSASSCPTVIVASDMEAAVEGHGKPVADAAWARGGGVLTIQETRVLPDKERLVIRGELEGAQVVLGIPTGAPSCLYAPDVPGLKGAKALIGKNMVFAPWRPTCSSVQAEGPTPNAALFDAEPGGSSRVETVELHRPFGAVDGTPPIPWLVFLGSSLRVPYHVALECFAEADSPDAKPPADVRGLLRLAPTQCVTDTYKGKSHIECRTSLGTWLVRAKPDQMSANLSRVTHGPVHFLDGRLVTKDAFAKAVMALSLGVASEPREKALYAAMSEAVTSTLAKDENAVRVTVSGDPAATIEVSLGLSKLTIGELVRTEITESTTYRDHEETLPHPKLPEAEARLSAARSAVEAAESEMRSAEEDLKQAQRTHDVLLAECRKRAATAKGWQGLAATAGCEVGGSITRPQARVATAREALSSANGEVAGARAELFSMPKTVKEWVMLPWSYKRVRSSRPVSVEVLMKVAPKGSVTQETTTPVRLEVTDDEVVDDAKHNVQGHVPDPALVSNPDALAPRIARQVSTHVATKITSILASEARAATLRALAASGGESNNPDYQLLDATAFENVGARIQRAERRGHVKLSGARVPLPTATLAVTKDDCLLITAIAETPETAFVHLTDAGGSIFDRRGANNAVVEICGRDLPGGAPPTFHLEGAAGTEVRWGIYRTK